MIIKEYVGSLDEMALHPSTKKNKNNLTKEVKKQNDPKKTVQKTKKN